MSSPIPPNQGNPAVLTQSLPDGIEEIGSSANIEPEIRTRSGTEESNWGAVFEAQAEDPAMQEAKRAYWKKLKPQGDETVSEIKEENSTVVSLRLAVEFPILQLPFS